MKKKRAKFGEYYYYINVFGDVACDVDYHIDIDNQKYENCNYFPDKESAESMARKLRAILKGADVIQLPSKDEITKHYATMMTKHKEYDLYTSVQVHVRVIEWLKSKIK